MSKANGHGMLYVQHTGDGRWRLLSGAAEKVTARVNQLEEHWTVTRRALVVAGRPANIRELATQLELPIDDAIEISASRATLALWGDALRRYARAAHENDASTFQAR